MLMEPLEVGEPKTTDDMWMIWMAPGLDFLILVQSARSHFGLIWLSGFWFGSLGEIGAPIKARIALCRLLSLGLSDLLGLVAVSAKDNLVYFKERKFHPYA